MKVCLEKKLLTKIISTLKKIKGFKSAAKSVFLEPEKARDEQDQEDVTDHVDEVDVKEDRKKIYDEQDEDAVTSRLRNKKEEKAGYDDDKDDADDDVEGDEEVGKGKEEKGKQVKDKEAAEGEEGEGEDLRLMLQTSFLKEFQCFHNSEGFYPQFLFSYRVFFPYILSYRDEQEKG
jgi:hypothetical protein